MTDFTPNLEAQKRSIEAMLNNPIFGDQLDGYPKGRPMLPGRMYRLIGQRTVEIVRWGDELLPVTDDRVNQIEGQLQIDGIH